MYQRLLQLNEAVGKTSLEEAYAMTPREMQILVAGALQHGIDTMTNQQLVQSATLVPTVMVDPEKFTYDEYNKKMKDMRQRISAMTDHKLKEKLHKKQQKQQQFINIFGLAHKKGR